MSLPIQNIQTQVDQVLDGVKSQLQNLQSSYFNSNGNYKQLLATHISNIPSDGNSVPLDYGDDWGLFGINLDSSLPCSLSVNVYDGPSGKGYEVNGVLKIGNDFWIRSINVGPESYRQNDWRKV